MVFRQSCKPKRQFRQIGGKRIHVHSVKTSLRNKPSSIEAGGLIGRNNRHLFVVAPRLHQLVGKETAYFYEKRTRAHRRVAYFQIEDLFWPGMLAQPFENRPKGRSNNWLRERTWSVIRSGTAAFIG